MFLNGILGYKWSHLAHQLPFHFILSSVQMVVCFNNFNNKILIIHSNFQYWTIFFVLISKYEPLVQSNSFYFYIIQTKKKIHKIAHYSILDKCPFQLLKYIILISRLKYLFCHSLKCLQSNYYIFYSINSNVIV